MLSVSIWKWCDLRLSEQKCNKYSLWENWIWEYVNKSAINIECEKNGIWE